MSVRKKYAKEFKLDAVSLVLDQGYTQAKAGRSLGLNSNMLGRWIREYQSGDGRAFRGNGALTPEEAWASIPTCWAAGSGSINPVMVGRFGAMAR